MVDRLRRTGPNEYRSTTPLPIGGDWKTMVRLHRGTALTALPIHLPADPAIPVGGVPARAGFTRPFGNERQLLQRERKAAAGWLWGAAYIVLLLAALGFLGLLAWGLHRISSTPRVREPRVRPRSWSEVVRTA